MFLLILIEYFSFFFLFSVRSWADKLGIELWHIGDFITRRRDVEDVCETISFLRN